MNDLSYLTKFGGASRRFRLFLSSLTLTCLTVVSALIPSTSEAATCHYPGYSGSCYLAYTNLTGLDLRTAALAGANLTGSTLTSTNIDGLDLSSTTLSFVTSGNVVGTPAGLPVGWTLRSGFLIGPKANLYKKNLSSLDLSGANLAGASIGSANLAGADLTNANLAGADLTSANLTKTRFTGADLSNAAMDGAIISGTSFDGANLTAIQLSSENLSGINFQNANMTQIYLNGDTLTGANLSGANLTKAKLNSTFTNANLSNSNLTHANLSWADMTHANLSGADLSGADLGWSIRATTNLSFANLSGANLTGVTFQLESNLTGANFTDANISGTSFYLSNWSGISSGSLKGTPLKLPTKFAIVNGHFVGPGVDLSGSDLSNPAVSFHPVLDPNMHPELNQGTCIANWSQIGQVLYNESKSLADLALCDANLTGVNFSGDQLIATNFSRSDLSLANFNKANLWGAIFRGSIFQGSVLSGANLYQADFSNTNLYDTDLSGATLDSANLDHADLSGVNLSGASGKQIQGVPLALPTGFSIRAGVLVQSLSLIPTPSVSGEFKVGSELTGNPGTWDKGVSLNFGWSRDGSDIPGANSLTYVLTPADFNHSISFVVLGFFPNQVLVDGVTFSRKTSGAKSVLAGDLTLKPSPEISGDCMTGNTISVSSGPWDQGVTVSYQWLRDGIAISGATSSTYQVNSADAGHSITVKTTGTSNGYSTVELTSPALSAAYGSLSSQPSPTVSGIFKVGATLTATPGTWDPDVTVTTQWLSDGIAISGATALNYQLTPGDYGHQIGVQTTGTKPGYTTIQKTSTPVTVTTGTLTNTPTPTTTGTSTVGSTLTTTPGTWDFGTTFSMQWLRDGSAITGATSSTYVLTPADAGKNISVQVTGTKPGFTSVQKTSIAQKVLNGTLQVKPIRVSGSVKVGVTLNGTSAPFAVGAKISYQWLLDGKAISGATKATYKLLATQKGHKISLKVTQTCLGFNQATATSSQTKVS